MPKESAPGGDVIRQIFPQDEPCLIRVGKAMTMNAGAETSEIIRRRLFEWDTRALGGDGRVLLPAKSKTPATSMPAGWPTIPNNCRVRYSRRRRARPLRGLLSLPPVGFLGLEIDPPEDLAAIARSQPAVYLGNLPPFPASRRTNSARRPSGSRPTLDWARARASSIW